MSLLDRYETGEGGATPAERAVLEVLSAMQDRGFEPAWRRLVEDHLEIAKGLLDQLVAIVEAFALPADSDDFQIGPAPDGEIFVVSASWVDPAAGIRHLFGEVVAEGGGFVLPQAHYFQIPADVPGVRLCKSWRGAWTLLYILPRFDSGRCWGSGVFYPGNEETVARVSR